ncbi:MAG: hypothetical protein KA319_06645 [Ferruginibacter sp.]|nr:hypothetical protein [Ferruginibacter sp.]
MNVLFWIVFIGLCIKTGAMLTSLIVSLYKPEATKNLYMGLNLTELLNYDKVHYLITMSLVIAITGMKAFIAYLVVKISMQFNLVKPFSEKVLAFINQISYVALFTGILAHLARNYTRGILHHKNVSIPIEWNEGEILFFAGIIFIIAQVFKKGLELQTENELTV